MTSRQAAVLAAIIEAHAEVSHPVGSVTLAKLFKVASSTIRNEMGVLEQLGYIYQPHTSAGRVPTDKGYRWYVNRIQEAAEGRGSRTNAGFSIRASKAPASRARRSGRRSTAWSS